MSARTAALAALGSVLAGCGPALDTPAGRCAEVVRIHSDLQGGVALVGSPQETPDGGIEIRFEGTGPMNLPVEGSATCTWSEDADGSSVLIEATVNGTPLDATELAGIQSALVDHR